MAPQPAIVEAIGASQEQFRDQARALRQELEDTGQCLPYSIVNFNPTSLSLQGEMQRYKVWSPDDERLPGGIEGQRVTLMYDGRERVGHCMTVRSPHIYGKNVSAAWHQGGGPGDAIVQRKPEYYLPVAVAYTFLEHFSPIFVTDKDGQAAPPPKDARKFYGVLVFQGDINALIKVNDEPDPAKRKIRVPLAVVRQSGKILQRSYRAIETDYDAYLDRMFGGQIKFADATISRAQQRFNGTDEDRKDISASDRIWYRWAIRLGYAQAPTPGEKTWLNELITLNTGVPGRDLTGGRRHCQSCRKLEPEPNTPFCPNCNAPINTFATFMAGFPVADAWLMALKGEERELVIEELRLRRQGFETEVARPEQDDKPARGPYKGGKGKKAELTIPGEE